MDALTWSILLLVLAVIFIVLEFFIPSSGVLTFLAVAAMVGSIAVAFTGSVKLGVIMLIVTSIIIPTLVAAAIRWWPYTPIGRLMLIQRPEDPDDVLPDTEAYRGLRNLIGRRGRARSTMLPSGAISIDGRTYDAVSAGLPIDAGQTVQVIDVRTNRIVVRPVDGEVPETYPAISETADDVLSRPVESLGLDDLDEPLA